MYVPVCHALYSHFVCGPDPRAGPATPRGRHSRPLDFPLAFRYPMSMPLVATPAPAADGAPQPPIRLPPCQTALEILPPEAVAVNAGLAIHHDGDRLVYYHYLIPVHAHPRDDERARDRIVSQLVCLRAATVAELAAALGLSERTIRRAVAARREQGEAAFDGERGRRGLSALTEPAQLQEAADLLAAGRSLRQVAAALDVSHGTVRNYRERGLLPPPEPAAPPPAAEPPAKPVPEPAAEPPLPKTARSLLDAAAPLGRGARDVPGRLAASLGAAGPPAPCFQPVEALRHGGLLTALPALLEVGLLRFADSLPALAGFYSTAAVLLLVADMLLARVPNPERLRYQPPGEWGRLLGLDRCPAPDVLRRKLAALAEPPEAVRDWLLALAAYWCSTDLEVRAALFFDGHVKVYTGQRRLARHFVSRERLTLPAAAGFWANTPGGAPLLALPQEVDPGLRRALWEDLLPELERMGLARATPSADAAAEPTLTLVFDREGWSPEMFLALQRRGVACVTWIKGEQAERWPDAEFAPAALPLRTPLGVETGRGQLAERPLELLDGDLEAREIRFWLDERESLPGRSGQPRKARPLAGRPADGRRQAALLTTHPTLPAAEAAGLLRSRWAQENAFKTLRQEFGLDSLPQHAAQAVDPARLVPNPAWRLLRNALRKSRRQAGKLRREQAGLRGRRDEEAKERRAAVRAEIRAVEGHIAGLERARAATDSHVPAGELDPALSLETLPEARRGLWDGLRMIAYRAETRIAVTVAPELGQPATVRSFVKALFQADANLLPDPAAGILRVQLLPLTTPAQDAAAAALCQQLNACRAVYPGTNLRLEYEILSASPGALP